MRGELNERRAQVILEAFEVMDKDKSGAIIASDLKVCWRGVMIVIVGAVVDTVLWSLLGWEGSNCEVIFFLFFVALEWWYCTCIVVSTVAEVPE